MKPPPIPKIPLFRAILCAIFFPWFFGIIPLAHALIAVVALHRGDRHRAIRHAADARRWCRTQCILLLPLLLFFILFPLLY